MRERLSPPGTEALRKSHGGREVVRGIDLEVRAGEIFAFLGPNGAGKTTTVEMLEGYRSRDAGEVTVLSEIPACQSSARSARSDCQAASSAAWMSDNLGERRAAPGGEDP
ncbi:MAG TPA: ATP-binding cassette domain-containing protein [Solirubrobacterales bacterium]